MELRIGIGFDSHEFDPERELFLGGEKIDGFPGLKGHSDGDVILHAITDAILGAIGEGDIGTFFSDKDPEWKGASSRIFVKKAVQLMKEKGFSIINLDLVYVAENPKISSLREKLKRSLSALLEVPEDRISLKGKRREGFEDFNGALCIATLLLERKVEG
jgi:2-C-methyl-D-erythritol 2,4-cyclodiphosphate synthase